MSLRGKLEPYIDRRQLSRKIIQLLELSVDNEGTIASIDSKILELEECARHDQSTVNQLRETRLNLLRTNEQIELSKGREGGLRNVIRQRLKFLQSLHDLPTDRIGEVVGSFSRQFNIPAPRVRELFKEEVGR